jgi:hypothetical protein
MKPRRFVTSFKIGIMIIFIRISAAVRPSPTDDGRPRIGWKVLTLYLLLIGVTIFFVAMFVVGTLHTGLENAILPV